MRLYTNNYIVFVRICLFLYTDTKIIKVYNTKDTKYPSFTIYEIIYK